MSRKAAAKSSWPRVSDFKCLTPRTHLVMSSTARLSIQIPARNIDDEEPPLHTPTSVMQEDGGDADMRKREDEDAAEREAFQREDIAEFQAWRKRRSFSIFVPSRSPLGMIARSSSSSSASSSSLSSKSSSAAMKRSATPRPPQLCGKRRRAGSASIPPLVLLSNECVN